MDAKIKYQEYAMSGNGEKQSRKPKTSSKYLIIGVVLVFALIATVIGLAVAIGIGVSMTATVEDKTGLNTITVTPEELEGEYYGSNGGIHFQSNANDTYVILTITTTDGELVVFIMHPVASNMTMMSVTDTNFMIMENQPGRPQYDDYIVPEKMVNVTRSIVMDGGEMSDDVLDQLDNTTVNETRQSSLERLAMSDEAILIIEAAQALGELGFQGTEYPALMRLYLLALRLQYARGNIVSEGNGQQSNTTQNEGVNERKRRRVLCSSNDEYCHPSVCPTGSGCLGQCGYECNCWSFICGNCCVHQYCLTHDLCCARRGFWSWSCLSVGWRVLGSRCTENFSC